MLIQEEIWKDVKGYEGYYSVSNMGRVKSLERTILKRNGGTARINEKFLLPHVQKTQYGIAVITLSKNSRIDNVGYKRLLKQHFKKDYQIVNQASVQEVKEGEVFRPIRGYEGYYEISNLGTVRSLHRMVPRKDGASRRVEGKILSHNYTHLCLSKDRKIDTQPFTTKWIGAFYPNFNPELHVIKKIQGEGKKLSDYQYFYRLEHNPITVTATDGSVHRFDTAEQCAQAYDIYYGRGGLGFIEFFFRDMHSKALSKTLDGYQFTFDHLVHDNKGGLKITSIIVTRPKKVVVVKEKKQSKRKKEIALVQDRRAVKKMEMDFYKEELIKHKVILFKHEGGVHKTRNAYQGYTLAKKGCTYMPQ